MNNLSEYIKQTSKIDIPSFPFDDDKLRSIIDNTESRPGSKKSFFNKKGAIIMSIIGITLATIFGLILGGNENFNELHKQMNKPLIGDLLQHLEPGNTNKSNNSISDYSITDKENEINTLAEPLNDTPSKSENNTEKPKIDAHELRGQLKINDYKKSDITFFIFPLKLTDKELEKINIFQNNSGIKVIMESEYDSSYFKDETDFISNGYPKSGIYRNESQISLNKINESKMLKYNNWDMSKSSLVSPAYVYTTSKRGNKKSGYSILAPISPQIDNSVIYYNTKELEESSKFIIDNFADTWFDSELGVKSIQVVTEAYPLTKQFAPVLLRLCEQLDTLFAVLWYPITRNFVNSLPEKDSKYFREFNRIVEKVSGEGIDFSKDTSNNPKNDKWRFDKDKISGIERLELNKDEMQNVGIKLNGSSFSFDFESVVEQKNLEGEYKTFLSQFGYDSTLDFVLMKENIFVDSSIFEIKIKDYTGWNHNEYSKIKPILATSQLINPAKDNKNGRYRDIFSDFSPLLDAQQKIFGMVFWDEEKQQFRTNLNKVLPVYFTIGDTNSIHINYHVWFVVTDEFTELLPERYRIPIKKELEIIKSVENGKLDIEDACDAIKGKVSYFGLCSFSSPNIKNVVVSPNPAKDKIKIDFVLLKEIKLNISLYNYDGTFVSSLKSGSDKSGSHSEEFILTGLNTGVYMIVFTDNYGSKVVQNLIINK